ncbi:MAG: histidine phosphatase family protein [Planctomycetales bacterium]|nr:histidine phosphatase family protein [Planctomycetales bacterium]
MTQIVLIRPGATDYDEQGRIAGTLDIPLCHNGAGQVARLLDELQAVAFTAVFAAPDQASLQTARAVAAAKDAKVKVIDALQNLDMGLWQGKLIEDVRQTQPKVYRQWQEHPETICPPEGETLADAMERIGPAIEKIVRKHKNGAVAIVIPEPLCSLVRQQLTHESLGDLWAAESVCGSWQLVDTNAPISTQP